MEKVISAPVCAIVLIIAFGLASQARAEGQPGTAQAVGTIVAAAVAAVAAVFGALLSFGALIFNEFRRRANDRKIAGTSQRSAGAPYLHKATMWK